MYEKQADSICIAQKLQLVSSVSFNFVERMLVCCFIVHNECHGHKRCIVYFSSNLVKKVLYCL